MDTQVMNVTTELYPFVVHDLGTSGRREGDFVRIFTEIAELNLEAERKGTRHVMISTTRAALSAVERKVVAELWNEMLGKPHRALLRCYAILPDALTEGAFTAMRWLVPALHEAVGVATPENAVELASALLERNGVAFSPLRAQLAIRRLHQATEAAHGPTWLRPTG
jgi:hypothetical protein